MTKETKKTEAPPEETEQGVDQERYLKNVRKNFSTILQRMDWTQKRLAQEMGISAGIMTEYARGDRLPSLGAILRLATNTELQRKLPFTIDQFLNGDIRDAVPVAGGELGWNQEDSIRRDVLGTYYVYFFDQKMQEVGAVPQLRRLRYGVLSLFETAKSGGGVKVQAFARFFKTQQDAESFREQLGDCAGTGDVQEEIALYRNSDTVYSGSAVLVGSHIFLDLFSSYYNDKGLLVLTAPEKKPDASYIGGLGNILSVTHGPEHVPVAQKIILSRSGIVASDEEITAHLLYGSVKIEVDDETQALLALMERFYSAKSGDEYMDRFLDAADKRAIVRQRLQQLVNNYLSCSFYGLCLVSKQDDHACYQFLKRHTKPQEGG